MSSYFYYKLHKIRDQLQHASFDERASGEHTRFVFFLTSPNVHSSFPFLDYGANCEKHYYRNAGRCGTTTFLVSFLSSGVCGGGLAPPTTGRTLLTGDHFYVQIGADVARRIPGGEGGTYVTRRIPHGGGTYVTRRSTWRRRRRYTDHQSRHDRPGRSREDLGVE